MRHIKSNLREIHFEGDEKWSLENQDFSGINDFFFGWFKGKKGKAFEGGCGIGNFVVMLGKMGFEVTGVEYSPERVKIAKENVKKYNIKAKIIQGDLRSMPYLKDEQFDVVFCHGVVEHFPETQQALFELNRIMKKDGVALISVPNRITSFVIAKNIQKFLGILTGKTIWKCGYEQSFFPSQFKKMLEKAGFRIEDFRVRENLPGKRFPIVGKTLNLLDKPLFWLRIGGGHFLLFKCVKS